MSKKLLAAFVIFATGILTASGAMADIGDLAYQKAQALARTAHNSGHTAGTILNLVALRD
jgi:hypothetical protein